jgi:hypothetical protein
MPTRFQALWVVMVHRCRFDLACQKRQSEKKVRGDAILAMSLAVMSYADQIDIDSAKCSDIIRRQLANQATSVAVVNPADCDPP